MQISTCYNREERLDYGDVKFLRSGCQVYAIALYVEAERAAKELGVRQRGGFFADNVDAD